MECGKRRTGVVHEFHEEDTKGTNARSARVIMKTGLRPVTVGMRSEGGLGGKRMGGRA